MVAQVWLPVHLALPRLVGNLGYQTLLGYAMILPCRIHIPCARTQDFIKICRFQFNLKNHFSGFHWMEPGIPRLLASIFNTPPRMHVSRLDTCFRSSVVKIPATKRRIPASIPKIQYPDFIITTHLESKHNMMKIARRIIFWYQVGSSSHRANRCGWLLKSFASRWFRGKGLWWIHKDDTGSQTVCRIQKLNDCSEENSLEKIFKVSFRSVAGRIFDHLSKNNSPTCFQEQTYLQIWLCLPSNASNLFGIFLPCRRIFWNFLNQRVFTYKIFKASL